jgi:hypothetical protein
MFKQIFAFFYGVRMMGRFTYPAAIISFIVGLIIGAFLI